MSEHHIIYVTFFSEFQTRYLISMFNKILGHGSDKWTIRNRILSKIRYGRVLKNTPVLISKQFDEETLNKVISTITYAELMFSGDE